MKDEDQVDGGMVAAVSRATASSSGGGGARGTL
jgi:hypothetical protein